MKKTLKIIAIMFAVFIAYAAYRAVRYGIPVVTQEQLRREECLDFARTFNDTPVAQLTPNQIDKANYCREVLR